MRTNKKLNIVQNNFSEEKPINTPIITPVKDLELASTGLRKSRRFTLDGEKVVETTELDPTTEVEKSNQDILEEGEKSMV